MLSVDEYQSVLERDSTIVEGLLRTADLSASVPGCPGWNVADLARHLGGVHRWAHDALITGAAGERPQGPDGRDDLVAWFAEGASRLVALLRRTDPNSPAWTFGPPPRTAAFWSRRQAHETSMHLGDAQRALDLPFVTNAEFAADGVDEIATMFFPSRVRRGVTPVLERGLRVVLTDLGDTAFVIAGDGTDPTAPTAATLRGPAADVLLVLWGRASVESLIVEGDPAVVDEVLAAGITP